MAKTGKSVRASFRCGECGWQTSKWVGRCGECQAWGTVDVTGGAAPARVVPAGPVSTPARPIAEVDVRAARSTPTGLDELDRVLGGGLVPGAVLLLAGEPGIGQSTLLLEAAARHADRAPVLNVTGEESTRRGRLGADHVRARPARHFLARAMCQPPTRRRG